MYHRPLALALTAFLLVALVRIPVVSADDAQDKALESLDCWVLANEDKIVVKNVGEIPAQVTSIMYRTANGDEWDDILDFSLISQQENSIDFDYDYEVIKAIGVLSARGVLYPVKLPPTLTVYTTPVNGEVFVNGTSWGTAPQIPGSSPAMFAQTRSVNPGTYTVSFGEYLGYNKPNPQTITLDFDEDETVPGYYTISNTVIEGVVVDNEGDGIKNADITGWIYSDYIPIDTKTDGNGHFIIELPGGEDHEYSLNINESHSGYNEGHPYYGFEKCTVQGTVKSGERDNLQQITLIYDPFEVWLDETSGSMSLDYTKTPGLEKYSDSIPSQRTVPVLYENGDQVYDEVQKSVVDHYTWEELVTKYYTTTTQLSTSAGEWVDVGEDLYELWPLMSLPSLPSGYRWTYVGSGWISSFYKKQYNTVEYYEDEGYSVASNYDYRVDWTTETPHSMTYEESSDAYAKKNDTGGSITYIWDPHDVWQPGYYKECSHTYEDYSDAADRRDITGGLLTYVWDDTDEWVSAHWEGGNDYTVEWTEWNDHHDRDYKVEWEVWVPGHYTGGNDYRVDWTTSYWDSTCNWHNGYWTGCYKDEWDSTCNWHDGYYYWDSTCTWHSGYYYWDSTCTWHSGYWTGCYKYSYYGYRYWDSTCNWHSGYWTGCTKYHSGYWTGCTKYHSGYWTGCWKSVWDSTCNWHDGYWTGCTKYESHSKTYDHYSDASAKKNATGGTITSVRNPYDVWHAGYYEEHSQNFDHLSDALDKADATGGTWAGYWVGGYEDHSETVDYGWQAFAKQSATGGTITSFWNSQDEWISAHWEGGYDYRVDWEMWSPGFYIGGNDYRVDWTTESSHSITYEDWSDACAKKNATGGSITSVLAGYTASKQVPYEVWVDAEGPTAPGYSSNIRDINAVYTVTTTQVPRTRVETYYQVYEREVIEYTYCDWGVKQTTVRATRHNGYTGAVFLEVEADSGVYATVKSNMLRFTSPASTTLEMKPKDASDHKVFVEAYDSTGKFVPPSCIYELNLSKPPLPPQYLGDPIPVGEENVYIPPTITWEDKIIIPWPDFDISVSPSAVDIIEHQGFLTEKWWEAEPAGVTIRVSNCQNLTEGVKVTVHSSSYTDILSVSLNFEGVPIWRNYFISASGTDFTLPADVTIHESATLGQVVDHVDKTITITASSSGVVKSVTLTIHNIPTGFVDTGQ